MTFLHDPARLRAQVARIFQAAGSSDAEASLVANNLVLANLSGHDSHGVGMVPRYIDAVGEGGLTPNAQPHIELDTGVLLRIDGRRGYGQVVGTQSIAWAIERARQHGSCIAAIGNSHHLGRIGQFAEQALACGLVSVHFVNVLARPAVAPWGGTDGRFGTNPLCIGIPLADAEPFVLDFATSRVAQGKMRVAHNKGELVPEGLLIDDRGQPTQDPGVVVVPQASGLFGALIPFGEHKGYGLAIACELLGGALTSGGTWHRPADNARTLLNGMLSILIDPKLLGTQTSLRDEAQAFIAWLRQSPPNAGGDGVLIAGEPERRARAKREREGILLDDTTWQEVLATAAKVNANLTV